MPSIACRYRLHHFEYPLLLTEVVEKFKHLSRLTEPASWRELMAYASLLRPADFCGCSIIAAGSRNLVNDPTGKGQVEGEQFAMAYVANGVEVKWKEAERANDFRFGPQHFYLMRVYNF